MKEQSLGHKLAEVNFRKKLTKQHLGQGNFYPNEPNHEEIFKILKERVSTSKRIFSELKNRRIPFTPFLEVGAEKCQRAMVLVNDFGAEGFATDLSFESLKAADNIIKSLDYHLMPQRICLDLYHLPFLNASLSFVFCFQTLHHLINPQPALEEIKRVLKGGGYFYFDEEPVKQKFNLNLWRRSTNLRLREKILKYTGILIFLSKIGKTEVDSGVSEEEFDLKSWQEFLAVFDYKEIYFKPLIGKEEKKTDSLRPRLLNKFLFFLLGGGIRGLCQVNPVRKGGALNPATLPPRKDMDISSQPPPVGGLSNGVNKKGGSFAASNIFETLGCPSCSIIINNQKNRAPLKPEGDKWRCEHCGEIYQTQDDILILLPKEEKEILYPSKAS